MVCIASSIVCDAKSWMKILAEIMHLYHGSVNLIREKLMQLKVRQGRDSGFDEDDGGYQQGSFHLTRCVMLFIQPYTFI